MLTDALDVALAVARAFDAAGAPYFLGGSLASSLQGEPRATNDIDFVVALSAAQVGTLATALGPDFSVDEEALRDAIQHRSSFNIYYLPLVTKIDLFILGDADFDAMEFSRKRAMAVRPGAQLFVKSPEDSILRKLQWFVAGGEVSTSQWRDVMAILRVSGPVLDNSYLDQWARRLGLVEKLEQARSEATGTGR